MEQPNLEVLSIKRSHDSSDGQLLQFLRERERRMSGRGLTKIVLSTLRMCWGPFVIKRIGADSDTLKTAVIYSISQLELQIHLLKQLLD
ncbi:hypothetical protein GNF10_33035 [Nostoc sp. UCD121]|jgi:hypothetical protein|uniref:Uncharacterized protein n=1 Tax=Nostoc minutum NIES-26 TaxID=1844469 RepID=A0A367QQW9_9NOSO|nr:MULTISPECIES: hypothetical protein [unclassified Nostoc]RCJ26200.1 hypothetical protein A6770_26685 [Nostoc minutum NIES-26]MBC1220670.1 hypothetical protein [Nostoc sp. UCD120]MBC1225470.1 hypothetical protein [Nostoc sp. UCD120]MBC1280628.1 hypothetical protein [Nostoc sp. UCD121]MBC1280635.1 hypothetical protein [Nostoc sp. UCD121]